MKPCDLVTNITALACTLANCCTEEELAVMIIVFSQLSNTLSTILKQEELQKAKADSLE